MKFADLPEFPFAVAPEVMDRAVQLKLALFDVDGVLTDGRLHYTEQGELQKTFHAHDGLGLKMLRAAGFDVGVISARESAALKKRLSDLGIENMHLGVADKLTVFERLLSDSQIQPYQVCFTGDDVIDLPVMQKCGVTFSVANGHFLVKHAADWVSPLNGGAGAVRSICDLILYSKQQYPLSGIDHRGSAQ